jgi:predicted extracellular nuclease
VVQAATIWQEDFESDGTRYTASTPFNDGSNDHWNRTNGSDIFNVTGAYTNISNSFFWAAEDTDDNGGNGNDEQTIQFNAIDISGHTNLTFKGLFGAGNESAPGSSNYDAADYIKVEYAVDGGATQNGICFGYENHGDDFNEPLGLDANCDGEADMTNRLGTALQEFSFSIPDGSSLVITIRVFMDAASEEIAFDNLRVESGVSSITIGTPSDATEGGADGSYTIVLNTQPTADVTITLTTDDEVDVSPTSLTFSTANWDTLQTVTVTAVDDSDVEGTHTGTISHLVSSGDANYDGIVIDDVIVNIVDNDFTLTPIYNIQGSGTTSPLVGNSVVIEGIVTGDFQSSPFGTNGDLRGFYVLEETGDGDSTTSDGIFVFESSVLNNVEPGDRVRVSGTVVEFAHDRSRVDTLTETQIEASSVSVLTVGAVENVTSLAVEVSLPIASTVTNDDGEVIPDLEPYEGMLVNFTDTFTITELYQLDRFGEFQASQGGRLVQFTQVNSPDTVGYSQHLEDIAKRTLTIDDGQRDQNPDPIRYPDGSLGTDDAVIRMGNEVSNLIGNIRFSRGSNENFGDIDQTYRVEPVIDPTFTEVNIRPTAPNVGGMLRVASFNVLNYFTTLDEGGNQTAIGADPRGADSSDEFDRQTQKLVTTLSILDADIVGLVELENDFLAGSSGNAIENLVNELNPVVGPRIYDWVDPGMQFVGDDAIAVGFIYDTTTVMPVGSASVLDSDTFLDPNDSGDSRNRAALAQTFQEIATGEMFTAVINHFKSKGSSGLADDPSISPADVDQGDGQAFWHDTRAKAAIILADWLKTDPTASGDSDFLIMGDINAYAEEDAITALEGEGYIDLAQHFMGSDAYSFVFDGQTGTLDYAFANASLLSQVVGTIEWHINADEADAIDYNLDFGRNDLIFDSAEPYRASDHDPVIIGLTLGSRKRYSCHGFKWPLVRDITLEKGQSVLFRAILRDEEGRLVRRFESPPMLFIGEVGSDTGEIAGPFRNFWRIWYKFYRLTQVPGEYEVAMISGDPDEYIVDPSCDVLITVVDDND